MSLALFILLQYLDLVTTILVIDAGGREANPIINYITQFFPSQLAALLTTKTLAVLGGCCVYRQLLNTKNPSRHQRIRRVWYGLIWLYGVVVTWNLLGMLAYMYTQPRR